MDAPDPVNPLNADDTPAGTLIADKLMALEVEIGQLYEHVPYGSHSLDAQGTYVDVNSLELAWLGYSRGDVIGKRKLSDFLTKVSQDLLHKHLPDPGLSNAIVDLELELLHRDGTSRPIALSSVGFSDTTGKLLKRRAVMFDMTESRKGNVRQLAIANEQLKFQHIEKNKRAAELVIANDELLFQNEEKAKRAAELVIANKELLFQNDEKDKRAAELVIANKELLFQNAEKDKRAAELVIANKELLFQNEEKAKRAAELVIANKELLFQNEEKAKRAAELATANAEILLQLKEIEGAFWRIVEVATLLTEMRDPYTSGHERRVAEIAVAIGAELGCDARRQEGLRVAGYLHDIGKITVPSEILTKPGKLKPAEYALIKTHPQDGYEVLKNVNFPWKIAEIVLQHHERHDGTGYPQGLKGDDILFEAKIIAAADVVEAMSSHRPYRAALGIGAALTEIELGSGTKFDPAVAGACLRLFRERGYSIPA